MNKVEFETIHEEVVAFVEERLLSKPQSSMFNILVKTRTNVDYKISKWKAFSSVFAEKVEDNYQLSDLALLINTTKRVAAIPYSEIAEIYAEVTIV